MTFHVKQTDGEMVASTTDPRLAEIVWRWSGGALVEYGLPGHPVGVLNVWDHKHNRARVEFDPVRFAEFLTETYEDRDNVEAARDEVAHG